MRRLLLKNSGTRPLIPIHSKFYTLNIYGTPNGVSYSEAKLPTVFGPVRYIPSGIWGLFQ